MLQFPTTVVTGREPQVQAQEKKAWTKIRRRVQRYLQRRIQPPPMEVRMGVKTTIRKEQKDKGR